MSVYLVGDPKSVVWSKRLAKMLVRRSERRKHNAFDLIDEIFENLNSIPNIFQEPHNFLIFTVSKTIYISLKSSQPKVPRIKNPSHKMISHLTTN